METSSGVGTYTEKIPSFVITAQFVGLIPLAKLSVNERSPAEAQKGNAKPEQDKRVSSWFQSGSCSINSAKTIHLRSHPLKYFLQRDKWDEGFWPEMAIFSVKKDSEL
jgi:hypothetical protein